MKIKSLIITLSFLCFYQFSLFAELDDTVRNPIPASYYSRCEKSGTTNLFTYVSGGKKRSAVVYLPYGYTQEDEKTRYNVLYLMHGGGGASTSYLGTPGAPNQLCWIFDNAIANGEIDPLIIVCPSDNGAFYIELKKVLIPAIDSTYNTKADRSARAFGGFSMGSVATWNVFLHDLDIVSKFIPMSGDSWVCGNAGGKNFPEKTATLLSKASFIEDYKTDFQIFAATGSNDEAYQNLSPQIEAMKNLPEYFRYTTKDFSNGNLIYYVVKGNVHSYTHTYEYLYNGVREVF